MSSQADSESTASESTTDETDRVHIKKEINRQDGKGRRFHTDSDCSIINRFGRRNYITRPRTEVAEDPKWTQCDFCSGSIGMPCPYCDTGPVYNLPGHLRTECEEKPE